MCFPLCFVIDIILLFQSWNSQKTLKGSMNRHVWAKLAKASCSCNFRSDKHKFYDWIWVWQKCTWVVHEAAAAALNMNTRHSALTLLPANSMDRSSRVSQWWTLMCLCGVSEKQNECWWCWRRRSRLLMMMMKWCHTVWRTTHSANLIHLWYVVWLIALRFYIPPDMMSCDIYE